MKLKHTKQALACILVLVMILAMTACGGPADAGTPAGAEPPAAPEAPAAPAGTEAAPEAKKYYKVGYSAITMNGDFFVALAEGLAQSCADLGLIEKASDLVVLDAAVDSAKEMANIDTFITQGYDLIFVDSTNPDTMVPLIDQASAQGAVVVCVDSYIAECSRVTVCYSDNYNNGFQVGKAYAESLTDADEIYSVVLSGVKGNTAGEERRTGLMAGILAVRLGLADEAAKELATTMNADLIAKGAAEVADAKFTIAGQGWGNWAQADIMKDANDLVVKTRGKLNLIMAENDQMLYGGIQAVADAGLTGIAYIAAADGAKSSFDMIKNGEMFAIGMNSPWLVGELGARVGYEVLVEGKDPASYPDVMTTEAIAVTAANVDEFYSKGF
ncbi:MAG: substrate-binding domain-containing protein [Christensenellaceae bacterium]|jgi:ribose transport system substrate-binding protein|nr:substrate-binding domain-containing protein [Christensenellaceae bacterium]